MQIVASYFNLQVTMMMIMMVVGSDEVSPTMESLLKSFDFFTSASSFAINSVFKNL